MSYFYVWVTQHANYFELLNAYSLQKFGLHMHTQFIICRLPTLLFFFCVELFYVMWKLHHELAVSFGE